jgi:Zn-finger nucleic acid-binding protein
MGDDPYRAPSAPPKDEPDPDHERPWAVQTWVSRRACPNCGVALFAARKEGFRIDGCGRCGGAWLDHATAQRAIAARDLTPAVLAEQASSRASGMTALASPGRSCPDCGERLAATLVPDAGASIDVCGAHGAWFDPREMRRVIEAVVRRRPPAVDPEVDRAIARAEALSYFRPPEDYRTRSEIGFSDWATGLGELIDDLARSLGKK